MTTIRPLEEISPALAAVLSPLAAMAFAVGLWALAAQIAIAANFPIPAGPLADWRAWFLIAGIIEFAAFRLRATSTHSR